MATAIPIARLENEVKPYAWGSRTHIPELQGIPNDDNIPQAELWMGAHPLSPSVALTEDGPQSLLDLMGKNASDLLGPKASAAFNNRLPFLFKALAAGEPLSIQAHPNLKEAKAGFKREEDAGIPRDAGNRSYKDDNHKPEVICALTPFWALRGFRPVSDIADNFRCIQAPEVSALLAALNPKQEPAALKEFYGHLMHLGEKRKGSLLDASLSAAASSKNQDPAWDWIRRLSDQYPGDIGALSPLFLNLICLQPGDGMFLPAGELHAYLDGFGIELMANSDNVLRGGLTPKFMDVEELLRILTFAPGEPQLLAADPVSETEGVYRADTNEFRLSVIRVTANRTHVESDHPCFRILLCVEGSGRILDTSAGKAVDLSKGESVMVPWCVERYSLDGTGTFYKAAVPE